MRYNLQPNTIALVGVGCPVVFKANSLCAHFGLTNKTKFSVDIHVYAMGDGFNYSCHFGFDLKQVFVQPNRKGE